MRGRPSKQQLRAGRQVWVDAQACSAALLSSLFEIADRRRSVLTLVGQRSLQGPDSAFIRGIVVNPEFQSVSTRIANALQQGDVVLSADEPLRAAAASRGAALLDPREGRNAAAQLDQMLAPRPTPASLLAPESLPLSASSS